MTSKNTVSAPPRSIYFLNARASQIDALRETLNQFNAAVQFVVGLVCANPNMGHGELQRMVSDALRRDYELTAQMAHQAIAKAIDTCQIIPREHGHPIYVPGIGVNSPMVYNNRMFSTRRGMLSLRCLHARELIPVKFMALQSFSREETLHQTELFADGKNFYALVSADTSQSINMVENTDDC